MHCFGRPEYALIADPRKRHVLLLICGEQLHSSLYWLQRDIFGVLACFSGDLMLHSSALVHPKQGAWIFCGPSGAGKSTIAGLLRERGLQAINDEVNWIVVAEEGLQVVNQPYWFGQHKEPYLPVDGLWLLQQAATCAFDSIESKAMVFTALLAAHLSVDTGHGFLQSRALVLKGVVEREEVERLRFNLDPHELTELLWTRLPSCNV